MIIFINELEKMLERSKLRRTSMENATEVFLAMYADHIVLLGDTTLELQKKKISLKNSVISGAWK